MPAALKCFLLVLLGIAVVLVLDKYDYLGGKSFPGIFQIPGHPLVGNILQVQKNPAKLFMEWANEYRQPIFQIRLGNKSVIVVNSFKDVSEIWKKTCVNSRPMQYTFHNLVSSTKEFTIGTTPFGKTFKKRKQVISQALNGKNTKLLVAVLDDETKYTIKMIFLSNPTLCFQPSTNPYIIHPDVNLIKNFQYFSLRTAVFITYGCKLDCYRHDKELADKIIKCENKIIKLRSPVSNILDFFPILRYIIPESATRESREERDFYMKTLYKNRSEKPSEHPNLIRDFYSLTNPKGIDFTELKTICLTMVSAGLDNTPLNLEHLFGQLSTHPLGSNFQEIAVGELLSLYQTPMNVWHKVVAECECSFIMALIQETLRYFTVLPLGLPRATTKSFQYQGIVVPEGATLIMNAFAANHDETHFLHPYTFDPYRWLDKGKLKHSDAISHFAFGKGIRMCSGNMFAFKEMYILVCRLLLCFKISSPRDKRLAMEKDPFKGNSNPRATSFDPKPFKYQLVPRKMYGNDDLFNYILN
ncbi:cytochrome P450 [Yamadazyma tenuis]|uniref:Cytochrome P450 n=1 Tax=Candida tenuis (strain ATCC 10573 / BCRC 21748 / CBS 615 / JCM 9827 / NBRC 10315 / NRRL Y-1498 / VKM Y-70) TaxID=590646 RepID=G3AWG0_CANTC|nr:uncharacterized protein CANTEDRAFT_117516 [Yamadazyma tenuis ATCC 10573]EGV66530.1 hypothetical protein CANTEDRAFT_117516 [Yamadazyma tenuis ATCC 10573]WEJ95347.1 cytochrome P450 [Yamadazyma tenuis]